jgi:hypothetical protein
MGPALGQCWLPAISASLGLGRQDPACDHGHVGEQAACRAVELASCRENAGGAPISCQDCVLANTPASSSAQRPVNPSLEAAAAAEKPLIENGDSASSGIGVMTRERWQSLANALVALGMLKQAPENRFSRGARWSAWRAAGRSARRAMAILAPEGGRRRGFLGGGDAARCHADGMTGRR